MLELSALKSENERLERSSPDNKISNQEHQYQRYLSTLTLENYTLEAKIGMPSAEGIVFSAKHQMPSTQQTKEFAIKVCT